MQKKMKTEKIKAWITKYALTSGIQVVDAEIHPDGQGDMIMYGRFYEHAFGKDWHRTPENALARAEEMRKKKIELLRKNIERLERITFVCPEEE